MVTNHHYMIKITYQSFQPITTELFERVFSQHRKRYLTETNKCLNFAIVNVLLDLERRR